MRPSSPPECPGLVRHLVPGNALPQHRTEGVPRRLRRLGPGPQRLVGPNPLLRLGHGEEGGGGDDQGGQHRGPDGGGERAQQGGDGGGAALGAGRVRGGEGQAVVVKRERGGEDLQSRRGDKDGPDDEVAVPVGGAPDLPVPLAVDQVAPDELLSVGHLEGEAEARGEGPQHPHLVSGPAKDFFFVFYVPCSSYLTCRPCDNYCALLCLFR